MNPASRTGKKHSRDGGCVSKGQPPAERRQLNLHFSADVSPNQSLDCVRKLVFKFLEQQEFAAE